MKAAKSLTCGFSLQSFLRFVIFERVWKEQFVEDDDGLLRFRDVKKMPPPASLVTSPYDTEARYSTKRGDSWVGV